MRSLVSRPTAASLLHASLYLCRSPLLSTSRARVTGSHGRPTSGYRAWCEDLHRCRRVDPRRPYAGQPDHPWRARPPRQSGVRSRSNGDHYFWPNVVEAVVGHRTAFGLAVREVGSRSGYHLRQNGRGLASPARSSYRFVAG
jgi:hypothetical protein